MKEEPEHLNEDEKLKAENDFMKMKIMLEHGAQFHSGNTDGELPAEIESEFLKNIIEFEKQFEQHKTMSVYDKLGKPQQFKPANEIRDDEIEKAWQNLLAYMNEHGIDLSACSPKVTARELYRFTTEELFKQETDDMDMPGWTTNFIYDEFYPDHEYENTRTAVDDCIKPILEKEPFEWMHHFGKENIRLNNHYPLMQDDFKTIINRFKDAYDEIELSDINTDCCDMADTLCNVAGTYSAKGKLENETIQWSGKWLVAFDLDEEFGYWYINNVQIENIML